MDDIRNNNIKEKMEYLQEEIIKHDKLYESNKPTITDSEYDRLYMELVDLEEKYPEYTIKDSPTRKIYTTVVKGLKKVKHDRPMLSQEKINTPEGIRKFAKKANDTILAETKLDGLTVVVHYFEGVLKTAISRGDGFIGEDLTHTIRTFKNVPKSIPFKGKFVLRMEALVPFAEFERINVNGEYSNPRNLASGTVRQLDASIAANRNLIGIAYDLISAEGLSFETDLEMLEFLKEQGFTVVQHKEFNNTPEGIESLVEYCTTYNDTVRRTLDYMVDGLVLKFNKVSLREEMGYTSKFPRWGCAYKFESLDATTTLKDVVWQVGKTGQVTPVALFDSVTIDNVNIERATLHNYDNIANKDIRIGDTIIVERANDVIPQIVKSLPELRKGNEQAIEAPKFCPHCNSDVIRNGANLYCTGTDCYPQLVGKLKHFASRKTMNISSLGDKAIEAFIDNDLIANISDIYKLQDKKEIIINLEGFGTKKYDKIIEEIENSKNNPLSKVIYGFSIGQIGDSSSKDMAREFGSMKEILSASKNTDSFKNRLLTIADIGEISANSIVEFFNNEHNVEQIEELMNLGVSMEEEVIATNTESSIAGKTFVITGKLSKSRDEFKADIENMGGKVSGSVSKKTDFLLMGDGEEGSSKHKKALELNTRIISEEEFFQLIK